ncbi:hypothetical protein ACFX2J_034314 [Malus domestica]
MALKVISALDTTKTQWYHFKAIIVAGMGLFTDAYDLFCIPHILQLLGRVYYQKDRIFQDKIFNNNDNNFFVRTDMVAALLCFSLLGTVIRQLDAASPCAQTLAFHGAVSSDLAWESKLPPNYHDLLDLVPPQRYENRSKKDIFAILELGLTAMPMFLKSLSIGKPKSPQNFKTLRTP